MLERLLIELVLLSAILAAMPIVVVFVECCAALLPRRRDAETGPRPRVDVLIPAHDEEEVLPATLASVAADLGPDDRILVVADNCGDRTAEVARAAGASVVERTDPERRGKGYALDFGLRHLTTAPDEVVLVVDADCRVVPGTIDRLARRAAATGRPVQANYVMTPPSRPSPRDVVSQFAVTVKNQVRLRGLTALGGSCVLTGSGMAFPRHALDHVRLAGDNIVEDMQLSFELLAAGYGPVFCPQATVIAPLPGTVHASRAQRTRWEHGHLQTLLHHVPRLIIRALTTRRPSLLAAAIDLAVPPLSLTVVVWLATLAVSAATAWLTGRMAPLAVSVGAGASLFAAVLIAHLRFGRGSPWPVLAAVPRYVAGKLPIYATFLFRRQRKWVRTDRDPQTNSAAAPHTAVKAG